VNREKFPRKPTTRHGSAKDRGSTPKPTRSCAVCHGPLPPQPWTGRPYVYCSDRCRSEAAAARQAERERWYLAEREKERAREAAAERRRNLRAGGERRLQQLQSDAWDARPRRCGWFDPDFKDVCQRRVTRSHLFWCAEHTARELRLEEEAEEAELAAFEAEEAAQAATTPRDRFVEEPVGNAEHRPEDPRTSPPPPDPRGTRLFVGSPSNVS
jgi:hypothetical protein